MMAWSRGGGADCERRRLRSCWVAWARMSAVAAAATAALVAATDVVVAPLVISLSSPDIVRLMGVVARVTTPVDDDQNIGRPVVAYWSCWCAA